MRLIYPRDESANHFHYEWILVRLFAMGYFWWDAIRCHSHWNFHLIRNVNFHSWKCQGQTEMKIDSIHTIWSYEVFMLRFRPITFHSIAGKQTNKQYCKTIYTLIARIFSLIENYINFISISQRCACVYLCVQVGARNRTHKMRREKKIELNSSFVVICRCSREID